MESEYTNEAFPHTSVEVPNCDENISIQIPEKSVSFFVFLLHKHPHSPTVQCNVKLKNKKSATDIVILQMIERKTITQYDFRKKTTMGNSIFQNS